MQGLDLLLNKGSLLRVMRVLYRSPNEAMSGRQIEKLAGLSNRATMMALSELVSFHAVCRTDKGNAHQYRINTGHYLVSNAIIPALDGEELFWNDVGKVVRKKTLPRPIAAIAIESPMRKTEFAPTTKVEMVLLFATGRHRLRAWPTLPAMALAVLERHGLNIDPVLMDINSMSREEHAPIWRKVEREGILLFGKIP